MTYWLIIPPLHIHKKTLLLIQNKKPRFGTKTVNFYTSGSIIGFENKEDTIDHLNRINIPQDMRPVIP